MYSLLLALSSSKSALLMLPGSNRSVLCLGLRDEVGVEAKRGLEFDLVRPAAQIAQLFVSLAQLSVSLLAFPLGALRELPSLALGHPGCDL